MEDMDEFVCAHLNRKNEQITRYTDITDYPILCFPRFQYVLHLLTVTSLKGLCINGNHSTCFPPIRILFCITANITYEVGCFPTGLVVVVVNKRLSLSRDVVLAMHQDRLLVVVHIGWHDVDSGGGLLVVAFVVDGLGFGQIDRSLDAGIAFSFDNRLNCCLKKNHDWGCLL